MKVGEYVRTENGEIGTIIECPKELEKNYGMWFWFDNQYEQRPIRREQIDKSSPNIIDLIEVGDYVNGFYVINKPFNQRIHTEFDDFFEEDIETIVTKEQFESMEYKVGELV